MAATNVQAFSGDVEVASNLAVNTDTFFVDTESGNVGIGTTNPVGVNGGQRIEGSSSTGFEYIATRDDTILDAGDFIGAYLFKNNDTNADEPHYAGMSAKASDTFGKMDLHFYANRDQYEADTPQMIIDKDGKVGIGTNEPSHQLHVKPSTGNASLGLESAITYASIEMGGPSGGYIDFKTPFSDDYDSRIIYDGANLTFTGSDVAFNTDTLFVDISSGRVGIGKTNPGTALDVNGSIATTGGVDNITLAEDATNTNRRVLFSTGSTGAQSVKTDGGLVYNPANNILTTTVTQTQKLYSGSADGQNATYYLPFRTGHNNNYADFYTDQNLYYNPSNNVLNVIANSATFANGATFANNATNAGHASNSGSAAKLLTNSVDTTNANYHIPFRSGHADNSVDFYTDSNLYYNPANNFINANAPYANRSGNTSGNANYANRSGYASNSGYANSAGSAYSTNGGYINGGDHNANGVYQLRQSGYSHFIQSSLNTMFIKGFGDVSEYGAVQVLCGSGRGASYNPCDFLSVVSGAGINVNGACRAGAFGHNSDDRIKYNETTLTNCLSIISALRPLKYEKIMETKEYGTWIPTNEEWETYKEKGKLWSYESGFIAQEVKEIPELAFTVKGEEIVIKEKTISVEEYDLLSSNLQIGYTPIYVYLRQIIITNAEYKELDVDESRNYSIHELEGYVSGDVTKTIEEFEQLTSEEQSGYRPIYNYTRNERIDDDEYDALSTEERSQYSNNLSGYSNVIPTQVPLVVDYNSIFTTAVGAIQELNEKVSALETRVTTLEGN